MFDHLPLILAQEDPPPPPDTGDAAPGPGPAPAPDGAAPVEGQPANGEGQQVPQAPQPRPGGGEWFLPVMLLLFLVVMFGMTFMSQRREKKKRQQMLSEMRKNDRVVTIGGIIGTVVELRDNEIVLKVDESSNTRMRFSRAAIQSVINDPEDLPAQ